MTESTEWQRIGQVPVDTGRVVLVDPMNLADVSHLPRRGHLHRIDPRARLLRSEGRALG